MDYFYRDPQTAKMHLLDWTAGKPWSCTCGAKEGGKHCFAVESLIHSFSDVSEGQYLFDAFGNVYDAAGQRVVNLGVNDKGVVFDDDGDS